MNVVTLHAHFDGQQICLDEPFDFEPDTQLIITILPKEPLDDESKDWLFISENGLAAAYNENEPEYSLSLIKTPNLDYERR